MEKSRELSKHHELLLLVGIPMIREQFLEYFGMDDMDSEPNENVPEVARSIAERRQNMYNVSNGFTHKFG